MENQNIFSDESIDASMNSLVGQPASQLVPLVPDGFGNASNPSSKQCSPAKHWCGCLNNYTDEDYALLIGVGRSVVPVLIINHEIGEDDGTPHLQIFCTFEPKRRPNAVFNNKRIHWEVKGSNSTLLQCYKYHSKKHTQDPNWPTAFCRGWRVPYELHLDLYPWQQEIVNVLEKPPNDRTVRWYFDRQGGIGKTTFQKWCVLNLEGVIILGGKSADLMHGICNYMEQKLDTPQIILINLTRAMENHVSYTGIEQAKDMCFFSGKYQGTMVCGAPPHVIVFANFPPQEDKVSADRWEIVELEGDLL